MIYRNAEAEYMVTINTAFSWLIINGVSHQKRVSTKASTSAGLSVCGTARQTKMEEGAAQLSKSHTANAGFKKTKKQKQDLLFV